jgi:hypothetical protein
MHVALDLLRTCYPLSSPVIISDSWQGVDNQMVVTKKKPEQKKTEPKKAEPKKAELKKAEPKKAEPKKATVNKPEMKPSVNPKK